MKHLIKIWMGALICAITTSASAGNLQVTVVDKEGKPVADAVVVLVPSNPGIPKVPLPTQVILSQEKMRFVPAVALVAVGTKARFVNNDPWEHHVRASAAGVAQFNQATSDGFELRIDGKADGKPAKFADAAFDKPGPVLLGCHLHASMRGHVYVSSSPWAAISNADGLVQFDGVPDGVVQVKVWQADQLLDIAPQSLTLSPAGAKTTMQLSVVPRRRKV
jgi:plastocyanin